MPRIPRVVIPNIPHHITQRGNRRQQTFFRTSDYRAYLTLLSRFCEAHEVELWCYALMPNHSHCIAVPSDREGLRMAFGRAHESYTRMINKRYGWQGYLWQGRFRSFPMDNWHLREASRYVLLNPVKAGLVRRAVDWAWSSARAHVANEPDGIVTLEPLARRISDWSEFLGESVDVDEWKLFKRHERTGRPLGDDEFIERLEAETGRSLFPKKRGGKPKAA